MSAIAPAEPATRSDLLSGAPRLLIHVSASCNTFVVHVTGELDRTTRDDLVSAATAGRHPNVTIDLGGVTFMDCSGYQALVAARRYIEGEDRRLTIRARSGQPARFLGMIADLERCPLRPASNHRSTAPRELSDSCARR